MNWKFWKRNKKEKQEKPIETGVESSLGLIADGTYNPIVDEMWDGEKNAGELGSVKNTTPDHIRLRLRSYDMNLKTDIIKIISGKFFKWVLGTGLKLQSEPNKTVLEMYGINFDTELFQEQTEALYNLYSNSKYSDYNNLENLNDKALQAYTDSFLGGDSLCIIRFEDNGPNIQVIDGEQVVTPMDDEGKGESNIINKGIEKDKRGNHVAFWVASRKRDGDNILDDLEITHERIEAYNNGILVAWMVYGAKHRLNDDRGIPFLSSILEKTGKLDRYVEASVSKAEQTANVVYAFEHSSESSGENILTQSLTAKKTGESDETNFEKTNKTAAMLRQSTHGQVLNLTPDSKLISLSSESETNFEGFWRAVFNGLCASADIPPEVALQLYEQNYSSSRAAINSWDFLVNVHRDKISRNFHLNFYKAWLYWFSLNGVLKVDDLLKAKKERNVMVMEAIYACRFTGKKMPHIDPLKEAKSIREMLGTNVPLMSHEQGAEALGLGDWKQNYKKHLMEEKGISKEHLIKPETKKENEQTDDPDKDDK